MSRVRPTDMLVAAVAASLAGVRRRRINRIKMTRTITWLSAGPVRAPASLSRTKRLLARRAAIA